MDAQSVIRTLMRQVEEEAAKYPGSHVVSLHARVGELSGIDPAVLSNAFAAAVRDTPLRGTSLTVESVVPEAICEQCGNSFRFDQAHTQCAKCGSLRLAVQGGDDLVLDSVLIKD